jgi:predicted nucleotidyltransferase
MKTTKENILEYLQEIKFELEQKGIVKIALFGSYARDKQTVYSDIDIAILKDKNYLLNNTSYSYFNLISFIKEKIKIKFHRNIDVFDLDSTSSFNKSIEKELIYV